MHAFKLFGSTAENTFLALALVFSYMDGNQVEFITLNYGQN